METIHCVVKTIKCKSSKNNYKILYTKAYGYKETVTIVGTLPDVSIGTKLVVKGNWGVHPRYGRQFSVRDCSVESGVKRAEKKENKKVEAGAIPTEKSKKERDDSQLINKPILQSESYG